MRKRCRWRQFAKHKLGSLCPNQILPTPLQNTEPIILYSDELLAWKLKDLDNLSTEDISKIFGSSRVTISNLINSARKKILIAILEKRPVIID